MRLSSCMVAASLSVLVAASPADTFAQKPKPAPEKWNDLEVEPETPGPSSNPKPTGTPKPKSPPKPKTGELEVEPDDPADDPKPAPDPNVPSKEGNQVVTENTNTASSLPNEIMWLKEWKPEFATRQIRAEFDVWPNNAGTSFNWAIIGSVGVDDVPFWIDFEIPFTHFDADGPLDPADPSVGAHTHFGNATFGFHSGGVIKQTVGLWGGAWVGVPSSPDISLIDRVTLLSAVGTRHIVDGHRFIPDSIPLRFAFGIDGQLYPPLIYMRSTIFFSAWLPNVDYSEVSNVSVPLLLEQIHEIEGLSPIGLGLGFRFQSFINVDNAAVGNDSSAHAVEPYIVYRPPYLGPYTLPIFARLGVLVSVNDVTGFGALGDVVAMKSMFGYRF